MNTTLARAGLMERNRSFEVHAGWGAAIALACLIFGASPAWAFAAAFVAGWAVEGVQKAFPSTGQASVEDAIYTGVGDLFFWQRNPGHCERAYLSDVERSIAFKAQHRLRGTDIL